MAATTTTLADLIVQTYKGPWVEALATNTFLLTRIPWKTGQGDGVRWPVRYAGNTAVGSYAETDAGSGSPGNQAFKQAYLGWKLNKCEVSVSGLAEAVSAAGGMIAPALRTELDLGLSDLRAAINSQLMSDGSGNSGKDITGLYKAIAETGTYAGLDRASYTWWKSYVNDNTGTPRALTEALMRDVKSTLENTRLARVTAVYTSPAHWYQYGDLFKGERRQVPTKLTGGYEALDFEGIPLIKVPGYTAGRMDFIDESLFEYVVLEDFKPKPLGKVKDADDLWITHYSQLVCRNPFKCGSLTDLSS